MTTTTKERDENGGGAQRMPMPNPMVAKPIAESPIKRFEDAYWTYIRSLDTTWSNAVQKCESAHSEYLKEWQETAYEQQDIRRRGDDVFRKYVHAIRSAWSESQQKYEEAYRVYLRAYQEGWRAVEPAGLEPLLIATVSASAQWVASFAAMTLGNWSLLSGVDPQVLTLARCA